MKKSILFLLLLSLPLLASAQSLKFAYFSYDEVLKSMPDYVVAARNLDELRAKYDAELQRSENDFHAKYEDFLEGQKDFAPSILKKRQAELQEMIDKNEAFKQESQRLLNQAQADAYAPVVAKLNAAIRQMGTTKGYAFILNTDNNALPYVDALVGEDITEMLKNMLK